MTLGFMLNTFVRQSERFSKKEQLIWLIFCLKEDFLCAYVCVLLNVSMFVYALSLAHTYICIFAYVVAWIFTYIHIFPLSVVGNGWGKGRECNMYYSGGSQLLFTKHPSKIHWTKTGKLMGKILLWAPTHGYTING